MKILVINPGSTSTKIAVYENETPLFISNIKHSVEELSAFPEVIDQFEFRKNLVLQELENNKIPFSFDAIIGRGGLVKPIPGGVYEVNDAMKRDTVHAMRTHACNLGGLIASELAATLPDCPAFIADPGVVDELEDIARITGSPLMPKITIWHALNQKAIARRFAKEQDAIRRFGFNHLPFRRRYFCRSPSPWKSHRRQQCVGRRRPFLTGTRRHTSCRSTDRPLF